MSVMPLRLQAVRQRIESAATACGRDPADIGLIAVSKTRPVADVLALAALGQQVFGENYVQEGVEKVQLSQAAGLDWHFIGPVQSNKTRLIATHFDWVHSIDRLKIAERLSAQRPETAPPLQVCVQVNVSGESTKSGCAPSELPALCAAMAELPRMTLRGLMAIPEPVRAGADPRQPFRMLREMLEGLRAEGFVLDTLSMGMSEDLEAAIAEGATWVRVGTAIFGARPAAAACV